MAPNSETLRHRKLPTIEYTVDVTAVEREANGMKKIKMSELLDDEICINGVAYNIKDFPHPGGPVIRMFSKNDVTTQYKMIHPTHSSNPSHYLRNLKQVGHVTDYSTEYAFDTAFEKELKVEVMKIVGKNPKNMFGTYGWFVRAFIFVCFMVVMQYYYTFTKASVFAALALGIAQAFIGLNVQHDANHGAASMKPWVNSVLGYGADFIGGSKWTWLEQHWTHHTYTNHFTKDPDATSAEPIMLFNDYKTAASINKNDSAFDYLVDAATRRKWYHEYQALFFLPVLSFYWLTSVFNMQIIDLNQRGSADTMDWSNEYIQTMRPISITIRLLYILMNVAAPFYHHEWKTALGLIWVMSTAESLLLSGLFSLSHNFEKVDRDPTESFRLTGKKVDWYKAQVETSSTYGSFISGYLTGGLNFQIEHHLFPRMSSSWYPYIAPTVREVCKKHGVRYVYYPWILENFKATFEYMAKSGSGGHWEMDVLSGDA